MVYIGHKLRLQPWHLQGNIDGLGTVVEMASENTGCSAIYGPKTTANLQCCYCYLYNDKWKTETVKGCL